MVCASYIKITLDVAQVGKKKERIWSGLDIPCEKTDRELFHASILVTPRKGNMTLFWFSS